MKTSNFLIILVIVIGVIGVIAVLPDSDPLKSRVNKIVYSLAGKDVSRSGNAGERQSAEAGQNKAVTGVVQPDQLVHTPFDEAYSTGNAVADRLIKSANGGDSSAQFSLGRMYLEGDKVERNLVTAYMWFNLARANGHGKAKEEVNQIMKQMNNSQIAEGQRLASVWWDTYKN